MTAPPAPPPIPVPTAPPAAADLPDVPLDPLRAPRAELGRPGNLQVFYSTRGERQWTPKFADPNPILRFPYSVGVFDVMVRTDDQVDAVLQAINLPILDAPWDLETDGVDPQVVDFVRAEIGLPEPGKAQEHRRRGQAGIQFLEHLEEALDALPYGFMPFEQTYSVTTPGDPGHPEGQRWAGQPAAHLRKLAARPPATIRRIRLDQDGGLVSIYQYPPEGEPDFWNRPDGEPGIEIPVNRLVWYVAGKRGADWTGVSILRSAYRPWKAKEQLIRWDLQGAERNSMGLPVIRYDPTQMSEAAALEIATKARAGGEAGIALPVGEASFELVGISGTVPELGPRIDRYNQSIGRASLAMFLNLGHDNGARALGDTFMDFFTRATTSTARRLARTFTEHVIRDLIEWNFGSDEPYPVLTPGTISAESVTPEALGALVSAKILIPDDDLEEWARTRYRLPAADPASKREDTPPEPKTPGVPAVDENGNPLQPPGVVPVGNPFQPVPEPGKPPAGQPQAPAEPKPADKQPAGKQEEGRELADGEDVPDGFQRVGSYIRRKAGWQPTLEGYAAFLAAQVEEVGQ